MALSGIKIVGDNKWRNLLYGYQLPKKWRKEFDWMSNEEFEIENFVKVPGKRVWYHAVNEFMRAPKDLADIGWTGIHNDTYFSGVLIKLSSDGERYKIGHYFSS